MGLAWLRGNAFECCSMALLLGTHRDVSADQSVANRVGDMVDYLTVMQSASEESRIPSREILRWRSE